MVKSCPPPHLGVIPDGNRRYATWHGLTIEDGYRAGVRKAVEFVEWCYIAGIEQTTWYGSSSLNVTRRPYAEVAAIHNGILEFCVAVRERFGVVACVIGDVRALPHDVPGKHDLISLARPAPDGQPVVRIAVNYSTTAAACSSPIGPFDLVIRTGGQHHLSGFLPIESSFAELWFSDTLWPAFQHSEFLTALSWYARQQRPSGD